MEKQKKSPIIDRTVSNYSSESESSEESSINSSFEDSSIESYSSFSSEVAMNKENENERVRANWERCVNFLKQIASTDLAVGAISCII